MPRFVILFNVEHAALARFLEHPEDRRGPVAQAAEAAGGKLLDYAWMFGQYDGLAIFEFADGATAVTVSLAVAASGALSHVETQELIEPDALVRLAQRAQTVRQSYRPPGA